MGGKGRPSFKIDQHLLRSLREKKHLTQSEISEKIDVHLVTYQAIERSGNTSRKTAKKLEDFFCIQEGSLQQGIEAPDSFDYLHHIERVIRQELEAGNEALLQALQQTIAETDFMSGSNDENREHSIRLLAEDIATRIEAVQLIRNGPEIAALAELTGLSEDELLRPANSEGIWFVNIHRRDYQVEGFNVRSEITQRASWAIGIVRDYVDELSRCHSCSDDSIRLSQDGFWYRIEIGNPRLRSTVRIDLVRCQPDAKGLRWVKPSWRDEYLIREPLTIWAKNNFNFVCDFEGKQSPTGDIRRLRLLLTKYDNASRSPTGKMVVSGNLEDMPDKILESFRPTGGTHALVQGRLMDDLKRTLAPLLAEHPQDCWSIRRNLNIDLNEAKARRRPLHDCHLGRKYSIELVQEVTDHKFVPVPWREKDTKQFQDDIEKMLGDPEDPAWATDKPPRAFEPYITGE